MSFYVVTKTPAGLSDCSEIVGVFDHYTKARAACEGVGTYLVFCMTLNRAYKTGQLLDVTRHRVLGSDEIDL